MSLLAPYVMQVYGRDHEDAWSTLVLLLIASDSYALLTPLGEIFAAAGRMWLGFEQVWHGQRCLQYRLRSSFNGVRLAWPRHG